MKFTYSNGTKRVTATEQTGTEADMWKVTVNRRDGSRYEYPLVPPPEPPPIDPEKPDPPIDPSDPVDPSTWQAEPPRQQVDTRYVAATGVRREVRTSGEMNAALDAYNDGDEIVVLANLVGNFVARRPGKLIVRANTLTSAGVRVTPAMALTFPKLMTAAAQPVFTAVAPAEVRLVGLYIGAVEALTTTYTMVAFGNGDEVTLAGMPKNCILDRCHIHGHDNLDVRRGVGLQGISCAVVDSWISGIHTVFDGCAVMGWNGPGPYGVYNSYLESTGENWMFGGADPKVTSISPSDVTLDRCHMFKPASWVGSRWGQNMKNLGEAKNVKRLRMSRCVSENNTVSSQPGYALVLSATDQERTAPWSSVEDVIVEWCEWKNVIGFSNIVGWYVDAPRFWTKRVSIRNNLIRPLTAGLGIANVIQRHTEGIEFVKNTFERSDYLFTFEGGSKLDGGIKGVRILDNAASTGYPIYTPDGLGALAQYAPNILITGNTFVGLDTPIPPGVGVDRVMLTAQLNGVVI